MFSKREKKKANIFGNFHESIDGKDWSVSQTPKGIDSLVSQEGIDSLETDEEKQIKHKGYFLLFYLVIIIFSVLLARLGYLQLSRGQYYFSLAEGNRIRARVIHAPRGIIYDRAGNLLAKNVPNFEVKITPRDLPSNEEEKQTVITQIGDLLGEDSANIEKILKEKGNKDQFEPMLIKENIDREQALFLELKLKELPGVSLEKSPRREYPAGKVFSHILGYTGRVDKQVLEKNKDYTQDDYIGKSGLELFYEKQLRGKNGKRQLEVDAAGKVIKELAFYEYTPGDNLVLSIDSNLQKEVNAALSEGLSKTGVKKGTAVAINPQTGEILSLVSIPNFDNNLFASGIKPEEYNILLHDEQQPLFNRVLSGTYLIGSTVKPIVATAALEEGVITSGTLINCPGEIKVPNQYNPSIIYIFPCWLRSGHGTLNVIDGIAQSCNVFFYTVGGGHGKVSGLGAERLARWMHLFGLGEKSNIDLPDEKEGLVPTPGWKEAAKGESWYQGDTYHMAIGQGDVLATPLQIVNYTACIASSGVLYQPQVVKQIIGPEGKVIRDFQPVVKKKDFISSKNIKTVREGMLATVTRGTARHLSSLPYSVAGKTGTAELTPGGKKHAWFTCFAPYDNPEIALTVLLEEGGEGSDYAVPVAKRILEYFFRTK